MKSSHILIMAKTVIWLTVIMLAAMIVFALILDDFKMPYFSLLSGAFTITAMVMVIKKVRTINK